MDELKVARTEIDSIDKEIAELFERRMKTVETVAAYKKEHGLPIFDAKREQEKIVSEIQKIQDPIISSYYANFLQSLFDVSKKYQYRILEGARYAYCGVEGAYAYLAAKQIAPNSTLVSFPSFEKAYEAVVNGDCDGAVLPLENSTAGDVGSVMDLAFSGSLYITQMIELEISHALLAKKGTSQGDIKEVWSHPQALSQCEAYLERHGYPTTAYPNTAVACKELAASNRDDVAVIANAENAELYGLEVLEIGINNKANNTTRFGLFGRAPRVPNPKVKDEYSVLVFTVSNQAGSLAKALNIIGAHGFNMRNVRSRPLSGLIWSYYFYIEVEGNVNSQDGREMLSELSTFCDKLKLLGTYAG